MLTCRSLPRPTRSTAGAHIVVYPATRDAAKDAEPVPVGVKQHLMGLQQIGAQDERPAVGDSFDYAPSEAWCVRRQNGKVLTPVKLEGLARTRRGQRNKGPGSRGLLLALPVGRPLTRKGCHPAIGTGEAKRHKIGNGNCFTVRRCLRDFPDSVFSQPANFSEKGSSLLERSGVANFGSIVFRRQMLWSPYCATVQCAARFSRIDSFSRKCMRRMMFKSPMWITPLPRRSTAMGDRFTWLKSQWKLCGHPAQFWVEINR